ncbi:MAG: PAC2 family protein [Acidimicrobiales bacterium]
MSEPLRHLVSRPDVDEPVLVLGLEGWIDAGFAASTAISHLREVIDTDLVATWDADILIDHRARRPAMHLIEGVNTGLRWPSIELRHGRDADGRDVLLLVGAEPDVRWRAFSTDVVALAVELGVRLAVGFGAYPAPVPHTRQSRLATTATSSELAAQAGQIRSTLDVPAGAMAAIERACADADLPATGLWAQVPHYVSAMPYPDAAASLVDGLAALGGLRLDASPLREAARVLRVRLDGLVADNPEHQAMVSQLEAAVDEELAADPGAPFIGQVPSGDELAAEVERFLRDVGKDDE